jgi:hypothetical protein
MLPTKAHDRIEWLGQPEIMDDVERLGMLIKLRGCVLQIDLKVRLDPIELQSIPRSKKGIDFSALKICGD